MRIAVLGSTGSIGTQTLDVARERRYRVAALSAGANLDLLERQVQEFRPQLVSVAPSVLSEARTRLSGCRVVSEVAEIATADVDVVVAAIPGLAGLPGVRSALLAGRAVALATKEAMAAASGLIWEAASQGGGQLVPVDSEHTSLYQLLLGEQLNEVSALVLTASGGPFRSGPADLAGVTPAQALAHPTWRMGPKVTIDSSTLMNKGIEVLEAAALYGLPLSMVEVLIHPQSIVHALVRFHDGNLKAHLSNPDMRLPIAYALSAAPFGMRFPGDVRRAPRQAGGAAPFALSGSLEFSAPDLQRFPCLGLAYRAGELGGVAPTVLNAADEVAVEAFLAGRLAYPGIAAVVESVLDECPGSDLSWDTLREADTWARHRASELASRVRAGGAA